MSCCINNRLRLNQVTRNQWSDPIRLELSITFNWRWCNRTYRLQRFRYTAMLHNEQRATITNFRCVRMWFEVFSHLLLAKCDVARQRLVHVIGNGHQRSSSCTCIADLVCFFTVTMTFDSKSCSGWNTFSSRRAAVTVYVTNVFRHRSTILMSEFRLLHQKHREMSARDSRRWYRGSDGCLDRILNLWCFLLTSLNH